MNGLTRAHVLRFFMLISVLANTAMLMTKNSDTTLHLVLIGIAMPLLIGCHYILKKYSITASDDPRQTLKKEHQAETVFARLIFSWFGVLFGGACLAIVLLK